MNNLKTKILLLPLLFLSIIKISAQTDQTDQTFILSGKIIEPESKEGVAYANITIENSYTGVICDSLGFFRLQVYPKQNLIISALGFQEKVYTCSEEISESEKFVEIPLTRTSFMIKEVSVYRPGTWAQFKANFVSYKFARDSNEVIVDLKLPHQMRSSGTSINMGNGNIGAGFGFNNNKKKRKALEKVYAMSISEYKQEILTGNFNKDLVSQITKETGKRLDALMVYINDRQNFSYQTSSYYIGCKVAQLHEKFLVEYPLDYDFKYFSYTDSIGTSISLMPDSIK
ncbi:carboxypeptidase-like regulatory domain-containing protein [Labilibaculum sp.]|uniref:carboxypeptidase-like regulatory domain-containing protein n=1 Tax=Labilibaculum sp. TaxID=2060723 RepID=UPI0035657683